MNSFFTADLHLDHAKILRPDFCARPYSCVEEMNEALIANWNDRVTKHDQIYILGDVSWEKRAIEHVQRLNGQKF